MFEQDINDLVEYETNWSELPDKEGNSPVLSRLFDNLFGWIDPVNGDGFYHNQNQLAKKMLAEDPSLDITALDDGFELEARRLDAIRQRSSRGFTIIDINPGLITEQEAPLNIPYEFLFDGTNFIPDQNDSLIKNFRSVPIDIAGNFVKVEYIYENNTDANYSNSNARPKAGIKYQGALKNTSVVNGQTIYSETNLSTGYQNYYFDNYARNKVYLGFGDSSQKPHIITKSGDYFTTYFNTLVVSFNVGAPKIRITVGFNSEKHDGPSDAPFNASLEMLGLGRLFKESDSTLIPFNIQAGDLAPAYEPIGFNVSALTTPSSLSLSLISNIGYNTVGGPVSMGYSVLWITGFSFTANRIIAANTYLQFNLSVTSNNSPAGSNAVRVYGAKLDLISDANIESREHTAVFAKPIRVVIPNQSQLIITFYTQSTVNLALNTSFSLTGYSYGSILKKFIGINYVMFTSKYITDSTLLADYNRVDAIRDN